MASRFFAWQAKKSQEYWRIPRLFGDVHGKNMRQDVRWDLISGSLGIDATKAEADYNNQHQFDLANKDLNTYNEGIEVSQARVHNKQDKSIIKLNVGQQDKHIITSRV